MRLLPWIGLLGGLGSALSAAVPDWAQTAAKISIAPERNAAVLLDDQQVVYLSATRLRERERYVFRLQHAVAHNDSRFGLPYNPDTSKIIRASAWVISPDQSAHEFKQRDFQDYSASNHTIWTHERILAFNGPEHVAEGDTLVCEVELEKSDYGEVGHTFQKSLYTAHQSFEVVPAPGFQLTWTATSATIPAPRPGSQSGSLRWEATGTPAANRLQRPRGFLANPEQVYVRAETIGQPVTWPSLARQMNAVTEPQLGPSPAVTAMAQKLTAGKDDRWDRIRALTEFVQSQIVYLSLTEDTDALAGCRPHLPAEVLANRYGDCKDKATLLLALLRAIGEDGRLLILNLGDPKAINPEWPELHFNHAILAIAARGNVPGSWPVIDGGPLGRLVVFDATHPTCPLGVLPGQDQSGWALLLDPQAGALLRLPVAKGAPHSLDNIALATLSADGGLTATIDTERHGLLAVDEYASRRQIRHEDETTRLTAALHESVPFLHDLSWHGDWTAAPPLDKIHLEFKADRFARRLGPDLLAVSPRIGSGLAEFPVWRTSAEGTAWLWTGQIRWKVALKLPDGFAVEELPDNWDKSGAAVSSHLVYSTQGDQVVFESQFSIQAGFYDRAHYEAIRSFVVKFQEAERRPILLHRAKAASSEQ